MKCRLILLAFLLGSCTAPLPQRVDFPHYGWRNNETQEIVSVERTDTATIFTFKSFFEPGWWIKVSSDTHLEVEGKRFALLHTEGITPDKELTMGEDGTATYTLFFEPLPVRAKTVDYIEGEFVEGGFRFYGIDLTGKMPPPLPLPETIIPETFPEPTLEYGEAVLEIIPTGDVSRVPSYVTVRCRSYLCPGFEKALEPEPIDVRTGVARYNLKLYGPGAVNLYVDGAQSIQPIPVNPGETLRVYLDGSDRATTRRRFSLDEPEVPIVRPVGQYAFLFGPDAKKAMVSIAPDLSFEYDSMDDAGTYADSVRVFYERVSSRLQEKDLLPAIREYAQNKLKDFALQLLLQSVHTQRMNHRKLFGEEAEAFFRPWLFQEEDLAWVRALDLDDPKTLLSIDFTLYDMIPALAPAASADTAGLVREYVRFTPMLRVVKRGGGLPEGWDWFSHPVFTKKLEDEQEAYLRAHAEVPESVKETPDVPDEKLLDAILAGHRGKPVLVDIWATWCAPCLAGIRALEPLKTTDYADVDFVYLAGENSPKSTWLEMVPTIRGDHYYLTDKQLKSILERLGSNGYPTYFVVRRNDMNGSVLVGYNEEKLKNLLNKALK